MPGALTLPAGSAASGWPDLNAVGRASLLDEILFTNPDLEVTGTVDFESSLEPLLRDKASGALFSLAGQEIAPPGAGGITAGQAVGLPLLAVGLAVVALLAATSFLR